MKPLAFILLGIFALTLAALGALWLWGSWAFSPKGEVHLRLIAQGEFADGVTFEITGEGPAFGAASHCVNLGTRESGRRFCAVHVEAAGPKPVDVRRIDTTHVEVSFDRPLAEGSSALSITLAADRLPAENAIVGADGSIRRKAVDG